MLHDLRDVLKQLTRQRRFTAAAILILTFGMAANATVFAVVLSVLLRPLPYKNPEQLVRIWESNPLKGISRSRVSRGNFFDWQREARSFEAIEAFSPPMEMIVNFGDGPEIVREADGTTGLASMLGVAPILESHEKGYRIGYGFWQRRFGGDPAVLRRHAFFEGYRQVTVPIVAVMPKGFDFPTSTDIWSGMIFGKERAARNVDVLARLKAEVTLDRARAELSALEKRLAERYPAENAGWEIEIEPLQSVLVAAIRPSLWLLYVAVSLLLALGAANVAVLFLARNVRHAREIAIRVALGASPGRLMRQHVIAASLIAATAGSAAFGLARIAIRVLVSLAPVTVPRLLELQVDGTVLAMTACVAAGSVVLLTLLGRTGVDMSAAALRSPQGDTAAGRWPRTVLVAAEIAACTCLLVVCASVVISFVRMQRTPLGLQTDRLLTMQVRLPIVKGGEGRNHDWTLRFLRTAEIVTKYAEGVPGVRAAAIAMSAPVARASAPITYRVLEHAQTGPPVDQAVSGRDAQNAALRVVSPRYFDATGTPLIVGRDFTSGDRLEDAQIADPDLERGVGVAIVSQALARRDWPDGSSPLAKYLEVSGAEYRSVRIVGVAADIANAPGQAPEQTIYLPFGQYPIDRFTIFMRSAVESASVASALRARLSQLGSDVATFNVRTMDDIVRSATASQRFSSTTMTVFAVVAVLLAAIALYTVLSFMVALRQREFAVRLAIGAAPAQLLRSVLRDGVAVAVGGVIVGVLAALELMRVLQASLVGLQADATAAAGVVPIVVLLTATAASYVPARRASRVDPAALLRE